MGPENAQRMLGPEGWAPTAKEAKEAGLVQDVVPHAELMDRAQEKAEQWVKEKKIRSLIEQNRVQEYKDVNWKEVCILIHTVCITMWKNEKCTLTENFFRQINHLVISLVKPLLSRNFCKKCVRVIFTVVCCMHGNYGNLLTHFWQNY